MKIENQTQELDSATRKVQALQAAAETNADREESQVDSLRLQLESTQEELRGLRTQYDLMLESWSEGQQSEASAGDAAAEEMVHVPEEADADSLPRSPDLEDEPGVWNRQPSETTDDRTPNGFAAMGAAEAEVASGEVDAEYASNVGGDVDQHGIETGVTHQWASPTFDQEGGDSSADQYPSDQDTDNQGEAISGVWDVQNEASESESQPNALPDWFQSDGSDESAASDATESSVQGEGVGEFAAASNEESADEEEENPWLSHYGDSVAQVNPTASSDSFHNAAFDGHARGEQVDQDARADQTPEYPDSDGGNETVHADLPADTIGGLSDENLVAIEWLEDPHRQAQSIV
ncbi:MAG: hypothetical protein AAFN70_18110, partial [Planctomycetota bacterium]